ncbi:MAG: hypothetical protein GY749_37060, partial [Desulfobacteraceae bacterium]|nr:hypothetical protein [Desulfobacteraceae bacterium]
TTVIEKNGAFPSISPSGTRIAFISFRHDPSGNIFVSDLQTNHTIQATKGSHTDFSPVWSSDGKYIFFSRLAFDTNHDGKINTKDNAVIYKLPFSRHQPATNPFPVTSAGYSALQPRIAGSKLFFLSDRGGVSNCLALPVEGEIPALDSVKKQMELAEQVSLKIPFDPYSALSGYYKVLEKFPNKTTVAARAAYKIGKICQQADMPEAAYSAFQTVITDYPDIRPEAGFSLTEQAVMNAGKKLKLAQTKSERLEIIEQGLSALEDISIKYKDSPVITAKTELEK